MVKIKIQRYCGWKFLLENYKDNLIERYKLEAEEIEKILNRDEPENVNIYDIVLLIGRKRGAIVSGGNIDEEKTARIILDEFRSGTIGKITFVGVILILYIKFLFTICG